MGSLGTTLATTGNTTDAVASGVSSSVAVEDNALALLLEPAAPLILGGLITTGVLSQVDADALQAEVDRQLYTLGELTDEAATEIAQAFGVTVNVIKEVANQSNDETNNQESSQGGATASGGVPEPDDEGEDYLDKPKQKVNTANVGDKVRTPDSDIKDFTKMKDGSYRNNYTGEIWSKSHTQHSGGAEWKVGIGKNTPPSSTRKITIDANTGKIIKVNK